MQDKRLGLYIHIPFCISKCRYCDFLSFPCDDEGKKQYADTLTGEIEAFSAKALDYVVDTIFIGGGTPSILEGNMIAGIMEAVRNNYRLNDYTECTIECNPGTITEEKAFAWYENGINRISIGLQSANNNELKGLGRIHTTEEFLDGFMLARNAGFSNINVDLMSALPYQTYDSFCATLLSVAGLRPEHMSVYSLIVEENTPLYDWINAGNEKSLPTEETERKMYYATRDILKEYGYGRYEVSNYARKGYECRHNLGYWERKEYAGFGLGAASLINETRYNNVSDMREYIDSKGSMKVNVEVLKKADSMAEFMFLGLRKTEGISIERFNRIYETDYFDIYGRVTKELSDKKLLKCDGDRIYLTDLGIDLSNVALAEFLPD